MLVSTVCFDHMHTYPALLFRLSFKLSIAIESSQMRALELACEQALCLRKGQGNREGQGKGGEPVSLPSLFFHSFPKHVFESLLTVYLEL